MDYAKKYHVVMFCNRYGDIIRKPFPVKNPPEGLIILLIRLNGLVPTGALNYSMSFLVAKMSVRILKILFIPYVLWDGLSPV